MMGHDFLAGACAELRAWAGTRDEAEVWWECERADWLLWMASRRGVDGRVLTAVAADCAESVVPSSAGHCVAAIAAARAWVAAPSAESGAVAEAAARAVVRHAGGVVIPYAEAAERVAWAAWWMSAIGVHAAVEEVVEAVTAAEEAAQHSLAALVRRRIVQAPAADGGWTYDPGCG